MAWVDPYWREAAYPGRCACCHERFRRGARILYVPRTKKAFCEREPCGQTRYARFLSREGERATNVLSHAA